MAGSGPGADVAHVEGLLAVAADHHGVHVVVAGRVVQDQGRAFGAGKPALAPGGHGGEDRVHLATLVGEPVLVAAGVLLVLVPGQECVVDQAGQPPGEDVAPDAQSRLEVVEAARAEAGLADKQQVPVVAEHVGAAGDGAGPARHVGPFHGDQGSRVGCIMELG